LEPLRPLDIEACTDYADLLDSMSNAAFGARALGRAWHFLEKISCDRDCAVILTVSGALTVAKLGRVFGSLISRSLVHAVITTGALVTHSLVEELGLSHYALPDGLSDEHLRALSLNRIYDSIEPESNLERLEDLVGCALSDLECNSRSSSAEIIKYISARLLSASPQVGLLGAALKHGVSVFVPALTDSEMGLYLFRHVTCRRQNAESQQVYDPMKDLEQYAEWLSSKERVALLTLGGGVPRNWAQQMIPYLRSHQSDSDLWSARNLPKVVGALRICPDPAELGHLSGSTYSEGITWGKFDSETRANLVEVACDATIVFPILARALFTHLDREERGQPQDR